MSSPFLGSLSNLIAANSTELLRCASMAGSAEVKAAVQDSILEALGRGIVGSATAGGGLPGNTVVNQGGKGSGANATANQGGSASVPPSNLGANGRLPPGIGDPGAPISMPASINPNATAEKFARAAFNGQTPLVVKNNITGPGSWVAIMPDRTAITYRPAGKASSKTDAATATVEINSAAVKSVNSGNVAKFKFPEN